MSLGTSGAGGASLLVGVEAATDGAGGVAISVLGGDPASTDRGGSGSGAVGGAGVVEHPQANPTREWQSIRETMVAEL